MREPHPVLWRVAGLALACLPVAAIVPTADAAPRTEKQTICAAQNYMTKTHVKQFRLFSERDGRRMALVDTHRRTGRFGLSTRLLARNWVDCGKAS